MGTMGVYWGYTGIIKWKLLYYNRVILGLCSLSFAIWDSSLDQDRIDFQSHDSVYDVMWLCNPVSHLAPKYCKTSGLLHRSSLLFLHEN